MASQEGDGGGGKWRVKGDEGTYLDCLGPVWLSGAVVTVEQLHHDDVRL